MKYRVTILVCHETEQQLPRAPVKSDVMAVAVLVAEQIASLMERMTEAQDHDGAAVSDEPALCGASAGRHRTA
jgi:hypothetical protein